MRINVDHSAYREPPPLKHTPVSTPAIKGHAITISKSAHTPIDKLNESTHTIGWDNHTKLALREGLALAVITVLPNACVEFIAGSLGVVESTQVRRYN